MLGCEGLLPCAFIMGLTVVWGVGRVGKLYDALELNNCLSFDVHRFPHLSQ